MPSKSSETTPVVPFTFGTMILSALKAVVVTVGVPLFVMLLCCVGLLLVVGLGGFLGAIFFHFLFPLGGGC